MTRWLEFFKEFHYRKRGRKKRVFHYITLWKSWKWEKYLRTDFEAEARKREEKKRNNPQIRRPRVYHPKPDLQLFEAPATEGEGS